MKVVIINKSTFNQIQINNVTSIAYDISTKVCTITASGTTSYDLDDYLISILW